MLRLTFNCPPVEQELLKMASLFHRSPEAILAESFVQHAMGIQRFDYDAITAQQARDGQPADAVHQEV